MAFEHYDKCSLLLPMDGANNGTTFTDWSPSPKTVTVAGNTKTVTAQSKYYGSSGYFDGNNDYLRATLQGLALDDFTIAFWALLVGDTVTGPTSGQILLDCRGSDNDTQIFIGLYGSGQATPNKVYFYTGGVTRLLSATSLSATWRHVALVRSSGVTKLYIQGVSEGGSYADTNNYSNTLFSICGRYAAVSGDYRCFNGYLQDLLIIKGAALWTSNFEPPARLIGTLSGNVRDKDNAPASRIVTAFPRTVPTKLYQTTSSAVDGTFSLRLPATESTALVMANESVMRNDIVDRIIPE